MFAGEPLSFGIALVLLELVLPSYSVGQLVCKPFQVDCSHLIRNHVM